VTRRAIAVAVLVGAVLAGCGPQQKLSPEAERGRTVYGAQCIVCHNQDPAKAGPLGPELKGSSAELLRAKVLQGTYPPGYTAKRRTKVMQPMPQVAEDIPALAAFLN
jgi:mono/diheme cytochrome c family protein